MMLLFLHAHSTTNINTFFLTPSHMHVTVMFGLRLWMYQVDKWSRAEVFCAEWWRDDNIDNVCPPTLLFIVDMMGYEDICVVRVLDGL